MTNPQPFFLLCCKETFGQWIGFVNFFFLVMSFTQWNLQFFCRCNEGEKRKRAQIL